MKSKLINFVIYIISFVVAFKLTAIVSNLLFLYTDLQLSIVSEFITIIVILALTATIAETIILMRKKQNKKNKKKVTNHFNYLMK